MATLTSAGVNVSVVDESAYGAPGAGTVPLLLIATRQDKADPTGSEADGLAKYTKSIQAGNVIKVTSQRELTQYFGNPTFTKSGTTVVQGSETSEYGLMAAYSYLGQGNQAYIVRANLNLGQLDASTLAPTAAYATSGGIWLDTDASKYGIHQWSTTNSAWENKIPTVEVNATGTQATIDGNSSHTPSTAASSATNGKFLVVLHVDNETTTTTARQLSMQYFYGIGGAWELMNSDADMTGAIGVTYDEHFSAPASPALNDIWVKTTSPGNGISLSLHTFNGTAFATLTVQGVSTTQATGAGAIGDFVPQDGSSATILTTTTAVVGNMLLDQQANTKGTLILRQILVGGTVGAITSTDIKAQIATPTATPANGQYWFDSKINSLDIYTVGASVYTTKAATYATVAPVTPTAGDLWVDTTLAGMNQANERAYPKIYKRNVGNSAWVLHSNTDQSTSNGVLFADITDTKADASNGGNATTISGAPSAAVYPAGMVVVNMAQSSNTVRSYNTTSTAWRNGSANHADGSGRFGRYAQRGVIATAIQAVAAGADLRDPSNRFSLLAAPNYPELVDEMVTLNSDRGETAFIIVDSPMRKNPTDVIGWTNNTGNATENGEDGLVTKNTYSAVYYPSGNTTEPTAGATVAVPASHMALYTFAYNDNISFQWFAPAGLTRGVVQNATSVGYITTEGEFKAVSLTQGQRDAMYTAKLNPITTFPGQGTVVFGQKTLHGTTSALDRVNVARLVAHLRDRFDELARPFLFEINDEQTRARAKVAFERFLADILSRRGLNDFAVVCDTSNNTPARIDRNEFYVDVAIEPSKAAEFIYIPIRLVNTGTLAATN